MERKIKIGVLGGFRGNSMISFCKVAPNVELVAICDFSPEVLTA
jgi:predicted dehydrogenase